MTAKTPDNDLTFNLDPAKEHDGQYEGCFVFCYGERRVEMAVPLQKSEKKAHAAAVAEGARLKSLLEDGDIADPHVQSLRTALGYPWKRAEA